MQRYMVDNSSLKLDSSDERHIISVMKMKINECFEIVYNKDIYKCKITSIDRKNITYDIIDKYTIKSNKQYKTIIACAPIKEQKMDYLLQKATELGVDEIIPIVTDRTVVKLDNKKDTKLNRWKKILKEASEQSHRVDIPIIHDIISLNEIVKFKFDIKLVCNTNENVKNIKKVLQESKKSDTMIIVVGPEGGFSEKEICFLENNDYISVSLGDNILRAETVPLYLLSVINYEFGR